MPGGQIPGAVVIHAYMRNIQILIKTVDKKNRNPQIFQLAVQVQIRIGEAALYRLCNNPVHRPGTDKLFQKHPFLFHRIVRHDNLHRAAFRRQHRLDAFNDRGENVCIHTGQHNRDPDFFVFMPSDIDCHICAAPPSSFHKPVPCQFFQRPPHRLAAHAEALHKFVFRRKPVSPGKGSVLYLRTYPVNNPFKFFLHQTPPLCQYMIYLHFMVLSYTITTFNTIRGLSKIFACFLAQNKKLYCFSYLISNTTFNCFILLSSDRRQRTQLHGPDCRKIPRRHADQHRECGGRKHKPERDVGNAPRHAGQ